MLRRLKPSYFVGVLTFALDALAAMVVDSVVRFWRLSSIILTVLRQPHIYS